MFIISDRMSVSFVDQSGTEFEEYFRNCVAQNEDILRAEVNAFIELESWMWWTKEEEEASIRAWWVDRLAALRREVAKDFFAGEEIERLEESVEEWKEQAHRAESAECRTAGDLRELQQMYRDLESNLNLTEAALVEEREENDELRGANEELTCEMELVRGENEKLTEENGQLRDRNEEAEKEADRKDKRIALLEGKIEALQNRLDKCVCR
jgi:chromosome segregation ATPase